MEHVAAIMVLIGCGHGDVDCVEMPAPIPAYETVAMCERHLEHALREASDKRPVVYGQCAAFDPTLLEQDAVVSWEFAENGELHIEIVPVQSLYAARQPLRPEP